MSRGLFASLYEAGEPFALLDTRERRDFVGGHWFGSTNVPLSLLSAQIGRLVPDLDFPIHLLDWCDVPTRAASVLLARLGYANVTMSPTSRPSQFGEGFVKGEYVWSKAFGEVVAHSMDLPEITPSDYMANHRDAMLFDVRPTAEYHQFTIPGSHSLPNSLLLSNLDALKGTSRKALLHCAGRTRSIIGACTLKAAGYDGSYAVFRGGTQAWQLDGHEREFGADRLFAQEHKNRETVAAFLDRWNIAYDVVPTNELDLFVKTNQMAHRFDVSDDAATGQLAEQGIVRISGTNLIQQTDMSIARYHVPVVLFDLSSGSRGAFAAFWLKMMGFSVRVAFLDRPLPDAVDRGQGLAIDEEKFKSLSFVELKAHLESGTAFDVRSSRHFAKGHLKGSVWRNLSETISGRDPRENAADPVAIVGNDLLHAQRTAAVLAEHGWRIAGIFAWNRLPDDIGDLCSGRIDKPVDESALFAGRHYGVMQDSIDYLAWEEDLPGQIDAEVRELWKRMLAEV